jgi:uncharacterized membrane protein (DUF106 family)
MNEEVPVVPKQQSTMSGMYMFFTFLMLMILFIPSLRTSLGYVAGLIFEPLFSFGYMYPLYTLLATGIVVTLINTWSRHYFTDWVKMARMQKKMSAFNKVYREALKKQDMNRLEKLKKLQTKYMAENMEIQGNTMKATMFTMFIVIAIFTWLWLFLQTKVNYTLIAIPWSNQIELTMVQYLFPNWLLVYSALTMPLAWVVTYIFKFFEFRKKLEELPSGAVE